MKIKQNYYERFQKIIIQDINIPPKIKTNINFKIINRKFLDN